ncbi:hypothetical protein R3P38DRAFT_2766700 [Favolaschia claudopus]|uniref:Uncharacterized protein n=1 Tax=Favolaschia claudopus TaxID=2862362 RepID=A0AAW0D2S6_9AGAR
MSAAPRNRPSAHYVYARQPLGNAIRARHTYAFGDLLLARSAFLLSSEQVDRVYRGEMRPAEQRAYIDAMYDFPSADQDHSLHQQMLDTFRVPLNAVPESSGVGSSLENQVYDLFEAPLSPLPDESDLEESLSASGDVAPSALPAADSLPLSDLPADSLPLSDLPVTPAYTPATPTYTPATPTYTPATPTLPATPALHAEDQGSASDSDAEVDQLASSPSAAYTADGYYAAGQALNADDLLDASIAAFYTVDGYHAPYRAHALDSEEEIDELMPSPSVAAADIGDSTTPSSPVDSIFGPEDIDDTENDDDEPMESASAPVYGFATGLSDAELDELMSSPYIVAVDVAPSPIDSLFASDVGDADDTDDEPMDSATGGVDMDEVMNSATGGLGYPADLVESDAEVDQLIYPDDSTETDAEVDQLMSSSDRAAPPVASPARSETSLDLEQLLSTPLSSSPDTSMEFDPFISSPATPDATPDTSMEQEDPFSPIRTPSSGPNSFAPPFTLGSPLELAPHRASSIELEQFPCAPPRSPSLSFFRIDRGYKTPDFDRPDSSPIVRPRRLITYLKRDRERYGRPAVIEDHPIGDQPHSDANVGPAEASRGDAEASSTGTARVSRRSRRSFQKPAKNPTRVSRRLLQEAAYNPTRPGEVVRDATWYTHYDSYVAVKGYPCPLVDRDGVVMVVISAGPMALESWWEWVAAHATTLSLNIYRLFDFSGVSGESVVQIGLLLGPNGPFEIKISGPAGAELARILESPFFRAISTYHNHMYRLYAPEAYGYLSAKMEELQVALPFSDSVFTTCELRYGDTPTFDDFNDDTAFDTMDATTVLGSNGGHVTFQEDRIIQELKVGHTVLAASGAKRINFPTVKTLGCGRRILFRQYVNAGVLRWINKGRRTDKEFEAAPEADRAVWVARRREMGKTSLKMFGNLKDVVP